MAGQQVNGTQLFSVEQIELLRRLRNSGITKDQLLQAFDVMDRLDRELGPVYSVPMSQVYTHPSMSRAAFMYSNASLPSKMASSGAVSLHAPSPARKSSLENGDAMDVDLSNGSSHGSVAEVAPVVPLKQQMPTELSDEMREFMSEGPLRCCEEVRQFVMKYNIKQQQVATLAGVSQSYVSRYMKGDYFDMSERSRIAIHQWYLTYKDNVAAIVPAVNAVLQSSIKPHAASSAVPFLPTFTQPDQMGTACDFMNTPRRERFVFRPNHLEILDRCFQEESYPTHEKREEIAQECNAVTEAIVGRHLAEKERVSTQIVSNWFANKRKDMKKLAREEGLDMSQVPFRTRGRPVRTFSDLSTPSHEFVASMPSTPEPIVSDSSSIVPAVPEVVSPIVSQNGHQVDVATCDVKSPVEASTMDGGPDVTGRDECNLSLSVEIAAVNQAILALTGQQPIDVKSENKYDENLQLSL